MKKLLSLAFLGLAVASCSAPQGKKYSATNRELPAIALPPPQKKAELFESQQDQIVALKPNGLLTVWLSSKPSSGYSWRLAEIPDPSVLELVSREFETASTTNVGQEKWIFRAVGTGDVDLRLWYTSPRREPFGSAPVFKCVVSVPEGISPVAQGPDSKNIVPAKRSHPRHHSIPKAHPTTPDPETAPFLQPVFRSSRLLLRNEHDGGKQQG